MKVWITKYVLTQGIQCVDAHTTRTPSMVSYRATDRSMDMYAHGEGEEWHRTPEAAEQRAQEVLQKKIASLKNSLVQLESMEIKAPFAVCASVE